MDDNFRPGWGYLSEGEIGREVIAEMTCGRCKEPQLKGEDLVSGFFIANGEAAELIEAEGIPVADHTAFCFSCKCDLSELWVA